MKNLKKYFAICMALVLLFSCIPAVSAAEVKDATINEEAVTLEDVCEPYLLQQGFLTRTPRGRCATRRAYEHLGIDFHGQLSLEN